MYCVTEFMGKGDLASFLHSKEGKELAEDEATLIRWAKEIAAGMHHLHQEGIVHRDLAARNLLLTANLAIKVSDFGLAKKGLDDEAESSGSSKELGPLKWMAPECFTDRQYSEKTDVWSYGVCLWEMLSKGAEPHPELSPQEAVLALVEEGTSFTTTCW
ncbi:TK protein kinase [Balamuthia mandrillaris]